jgi:hypothetical protein
MMHWPGARQAAHRRCLCRPSGGPSSFPCHPSPGASASPACPWSRGGPCHPAAQSPGQRHLEGQTRGTCTCSNGRQWKGVCVCVRVWAGGWGADDQLIDAALPKPACILMPTVAPSLLIDAPVAGMELLWACTQAQANVLIPAQAHPD